MNILDSILKIAGLGRIKAQVPSAIAESGSADPFTIWRSSKKVPADRAFEVYAGWVYACIRAIAEEIASMRFKLVRVKKDGTEEEVFEHELLDLLGGVNPNQTGIELKYSSAAHLEAAGNSYWFLEGVENEGGKPTAIYLLNPAKVKVVADRNVFPSQVEKYEYRTWTRKYEFLPHQILHFKYADPIDPYEGVGTVQTLAQWIDADNYAMEFNRRFFLNGARIGGFLESESAYTPEQLDYLKKSFEAIHRGVENAHKVLALPKGTTYKEASKDPKEMDFARLMDMMRDRILAGFRVPRTVLGITDDVNRANAEATNYVFALRTIKPKMELITSYLNEFLVPRYGDDLFLTFEDPVPENREQRIAEMKEALAGQASISINEAREDYFGLPPIEGGDAVRSSSVFSQEIGAPSKTQKAERHSQKSGAPKRIRTRAARNSNKRKEISSELGRKVSEAFKELNEKMKDSKNLATLTDEEFEHVWKAFAGRVAPFEEQASKAIRKLNAEQKKAVLENLPKAAKAVSEADLFDKEEWIGAAIDLATPILGSLYEQEGKEAALLLGTDIDPFTPEAKKALDRSVKLMAESYNKTTLGLLKEKLEQGQRDGLALPELQKIVGEVYEFSDEVRAAQVARTETFRIANGATKNAWKETGVVKSIKWFTAADERVCPWCEPMHGKTVGIEENFFNKGGTAAGSDGSTLPLDYDDVGHPPLHVSCRCYIRPEQIEI